MGESDYPIIKNTEEEAEFPGCRNSVVEGKDSLSPGGSLFSHILSFLFQISKDPIFVPGVWGPYFSAMVPGFWLNEGGQSVTGKLVSWYFLWL